ncbi:6-carboxytetrahydropterin synthase [Paraburkholderia sp. EG304]|uniref:6-carboxytetrahydropterin synthase n=1 Tax=Paraburkholderia sp. EG304 TaxID=3237015 RepID=UPI00397C5253
MTGPIKTLIKLRGLRRGGPRDAFARRRVACLTSNHHDERCHAGLTTGSQSRMRRIPDHRMTAIDFRLRTGERYHDISCGHRIYWHEGDRQNLHGHSYRIHLVCEAVPVNGLGRDRLRVVKTLLCDWTEDIGIIVYCCE